MVFRAIPRTEEFELTKNELESKHPDYPVYRPTNNFQNESAHDLVTMFYLAFPHLPTLQFENAQVNLEFVKRGPTNAENLVYRLQIPLYLLLRLIRVDSFLYVAIQRQWAFQEHRSQIRGTPLDEEQQSSIQFLPLHRSNINKPPIKLAKFQLKWDQLGPYQKFLPQSTKPFYCISFTNQSDYSIVVLDPECEGGTFRPLYYHECRTVSVDLSAIECASESVIEAFLGRLRSQCATLTWAISPDCNAPVPAVGLLKKKNNLGSERITYINFCEFLGMISI